MKSLTSILLSILSFTAFAQTTLTVTNLNDSGPGSLRQQVFNSNSGDHIVFDANLLNNGSDTLYLNFPIIVDNGVRITGLIRGGDTLFISGHDSTQIFYMDFTNVPGQEVYLDSLVVVDAKKYAQDGSVHTENGGAIFTTDADTLVIANSSFKGCHVEGSGRGGALYIRNTPSVIRKTKFIGNYLSGAATGYTGMGGAVAFSSGVLLIEDCEFRHNSSLTFAGAVYLVLTEFSVINTLFTENETGLTRQNNINPDGGAMSIRFCDSGEIKDCRFFSNTSYGKGGALNLLDIDVNLSVQAIRLEGCHFSDNSSQEDGGAIHTSRVGVDMSMCTIDNNRSTSSSQSFGGSALSVISASIVIDRSSCADNYTSGGYGLIAAYGNSVFSISRSSFSKNYSLAGSSGQPPIFSGSIDSISFSSSIFSSIPSNATINTASSVTSLGNNIFSDSPSFAIASDQTNVDSTMLALEPLAMNGGVTPTMLPGRTSVALNMGNPVDFTDAQNGPIYGRRDVGAAERPVITFDTTSACSPVNWWGSTYNSAGTYSDTAYNANSIDSVGVLVLELQDTSVFELDGTLYASEQDTNTTYQWVDCANNYSPVSGATNQGFLPPANGSYAVILTNQNCVDTSSCISYNRFSVAERSTRSKWLTFYPNPTSGLLYISTEGVSAERVDVLDLSGRLVNTYVLEGQPSISLSHLAKGTYVLKWISSRGEHQTDLVIIQ